MIKIFGKAMTHIDKGTRNFLEATLKKEEDCLNTTINVLLDLHRLQTHNGKWQLLGKEYVFKKCDGYWVEELFHQSQFENIEKIEVFIDKDKELITCYVWPFPWQCTKKEYSFLDWANYMRIALKPISKWRSIDEPFEATQL